MNIQKKLELITRNTEEVLTREDLLKLLESEESLKHYIGFEISGKIHLGTGLVSMAKVKDFMDAGVEVSIFLADWHTWINDKLGGDREKIKEVAVNYFKEGMKASLKCLGGDPEKVKFILGSDLYEKNNGYWSTMVDVSKNTTLSRIKRSITIMGRKEEGEIDFAKLLYPPMQVADIFFQGVHLAHAGLDQRKAHVISRDVALKIKTNSLKNKKGEVIKPIAIHQGLILGLGKPPVWPVKKENLKEILSELKMSKSKPDTCVFIHDDPEEIKRKINNAFCPEGEIDFNPILNWTKCLIFNSENQILSVERPEKFGGNINYSSYSQLEKDFAEKNLHPMDLKNAVSKKIIEILKPARDHFEIPKNKKMLEELEEMLNEDKK